MVLFVVAPGSLVMSSMDSRPQTQLGIAALQHVDSPQTRGRTYVSYTGRQTSSPLYHLGSPRNYNFYMNVRISMEGITSCLIDMPIL